MKQGNFYQNLKREGEQIELFLEEQTQKKTEKEREKQK